MVLHARLVWRVGTVSQAKLGIWLEDVSKTWTGHSFDLIGYTRPGVSFNYGCVAAAANTTPLATAGDMMAAIRPAQFQFGSTSSQEIINFFLLSEAK